jgi:dUTP pyrophosphatase
MAEHKTRDSAGADVEAAETVTILPGSYELIKTGEFVPENMPSGHYLELTPRSSICLKRWLDMPNSVGVIDLDYPDEILLPLRNLGDKPVTINKGERIGQLICKPYVQIYPVLDNERTGGFGSTNNER